MTIRKRRPTSPLPFDAMARMFGILADPTRLRLLKAMSLECKSVSRLVQESGVAQPLVSRHLRILRDAGLARSQRRGAYVFY
jgi:DNA-binding transcriptional ArsR family regulator